MKDARWGVTMVVIGAMLLLLLQLFPNKYTIERPRKCILLSKLERDGGYKVSGSFIMILKELEHNNNFDITVTPTTYALNNVGDTLTFTLSEDQIQPDSSKEALAIFRVFLLFAAWMCLLLGLVKIFLWIIS
jgi:hypothetical protein